MWSTRKPFASSRAAYSAGVGKNQGIAAAPSTPRRSSAATSATTIDATFPLPPNSPANRPPGRSARATPRSTASGSPIQCSAALETTASNSSAKTSRRPSPTNASTPRARARPQRVRPMRRPPVRCAPDVATMSVNAPSPQPRSRMRSPDLGASKSISGAPSSATKRAFRAYVSASQICPASCMRPASPSARQESWKRRRECQTFGNTTSMIRRVHAR